VKSKILVAVIVLVILAVIIFTVYYVKNVMIVADKDGMVFTAENQISQDNDNATETQD